MLDESRTRDIELPTGGRVRLSGDKLTVYEAVEHGCQRRADVTRAEALETVASWIGRPAVTHAWSGRFSDLVKMGVLEVAPEKRDDRHSLALRAATGRASQVKAWRLPAARADQAQQRLAA
jgi:hypothetical protein